METMSCHQCGESFPIDKRTSCACFKPATEELLSVDQRRLVLGSSDLTDWIKQLRKKFNLPVPPQKMDAEWWAGYDEALKDLERFIERQSTENESSDAAALRPELSLRAYRRRPSTTC